MSSALLPGRSPNPGVGLVPVLYHPAQYAVAVQAYQPFLQTLEAAELPKDTTQPCLWFDGEQLQLVAAGAAMRAWVTTEEVSKRAAGASLLARACNLAPRQPVSVLDAMAGWGVDGLALQQRGAQVTQLERNPGAWALLHDLRRRFGYSADLADIRCTDAWPVLNDTTIVVDVVYLDPMFAVRKKSALPNKRLQLLAQITDAGQSAPNPAKPNEPSLAQWVAVAQQVASQRVVVKRRLKDPPMQPGPAWQLKGKTVRYDCYPGLAR